MKSEVRGQLKGAASECLYLRGNLAGSRSQNTGWFRKGLTRLSFDGHLTWEKYAHPVENSIFSSQPSTTLGVRNGLTRKCIWDILEGKTSKISNAIRISKVSSNGREPPSHRGTLSDGVKHLRHAVVHCGGRGDFEITMSTCALGMNSALRLDGKKVNKDGRRLKEVLTTRSLTKCASCSIWNNTNEEKDRVWGRDKYQISRLD
jgi:hypothetical protein